jgi:putative sigma-54 modulation protein
MDFFFYFCYNYFKKGYDNMKYNIRGDKLEVTSAIENYVENKLDRLNKYFQNDEVVANVLLKVRGREQIIEVTIPADKYILRGEVGNDDLYSAIDLVTDKLERQIRKNKTRLSKQNKGYKDLNLNFDIEENDIEDESIKYNIVKRKTLEMKPMDEEEAILEMNLLGHDFFVYKDMHSDNICILYKRKDGEYGILETK